MEEPITFRIVSVIEDTHGNVVSRDTFERNNLSYDNLVMIQGKILQAGINLAMSLQHEAEGANQQTDESAKVPVGTLSNKSRR